MKDFEEEDKFNMPKTFLKLKEKQKEQMERQKKSEQNQEKNTISNSPKIREALKKREDSKKDDININSDTILLMEASLHLSSNILMKDDSSIAISEHFQKYIKRHQILMDIIEEKMNFNFDDNNQKSIYSNVSKTVTEIVESTYNLKEEFLKERFELLCNEIINNKKNWKGNEKVAPLLSIRARATVFESSLKCWEVMSEFPFVEDVDQKSIDLFNIIINLSKDMALKWDEELGDIERQQLYISIVPSITKIAQKTWYNYVLNHLDGDYKPLKQIKEDTKNEINNILKVKNITKEKSEIVSTSLSDNIFNLMDKYSSKYNIQQSSFSNKVKKTILKQIKKVYFESLESIINNLKNEDIENIDSQVEEINDIIESNVEATNPTIKISQEKFYKELKNGVVNMWGATQVLYRIRR